LEGQLTSTRATAADVKDYHGGFRDGSGGSKRTLRRTAVSPLPYRRFSLSPRVCGSERGMCDVTNQSIRSDRLTWEVVSWPCEILAARSSRSWTGRLAGRAWLGMADLGAPAALGLYLFQLQQAQTSPPHHYRWVWPAIVLCIVMGGGRTMPVCAEDSETANWSRRRRFGKRGNETQTAREKQSRNPASAAGDGNQEGL